MTSLDTDWGANNKCTAGYRLLGDGTNALLGFDKRLLLGDGTNPLLGTDSLGDEQMHYWILTKDYY